jgi:2-keto-4-pentenoate hydratase/2-oxohepta-3-ene-1,7-dioic acid hydratase in catechol pathway
VFLKDGDVVELGIEGLGTQKQTFAPGRFLADQDQLMA